MLLLANALHVARVDTSDTLEFLRRNSPRKLRSSREEREELNAILPWGLGGVIETVATTLDDIISEAMERRPGRTGPEDVGVEHASPSAPPSSSPPSTSSTSSSTSSSSSSHALWNISWNDIFGGDTEDDEDDEDDEDEQASGDLSRALQRASADGREVQKLQKELRRYRNQNGRLKKKIAALEGELAHRPAADTRGPRPDGDAEDEVVTMQIEHLLAQKSKLGYENDSLKRENKRLEELVDYFLGTGCGGDGSISDDGSDSNSSYSLAS